MPPAALRPPVGAAEPSGSLGSAASAAPSSGGTAAVPAAVPIDAPPAWSPLYLQIKQRLVQALHAGEWRPGEAIPSEIELAARFRVSQGTVRKAIDELATDNLLVRRQGKGTFVATHAEEQTRFRFLRLTPDDPARDAGFDRRLLECRRQRASAEVAAALQLAAGESVLLVRRLLLDEPRPVVYEELQLPAQPFRGLTADRLQAYEGPMYGLFELEFGVRMIRAEERLRAVVAEGAPAQALQLPAGAPLLLVERVAYTYGDRPVEWRRGWYETSSHHYRNALM